MVARSKGGVSSRVGWTSEGMVTMWWARMKVMSEANWSWKASRSLSGAGWMVASSARTSSGVLVGSTSLGDAGELGLVLVQVGVGDFEQAVEGDVDHLVVEELFAEGVGAEAVVAVGAGEEVGLHPGAVVLEGLDDGGVGLREVGFGCGRRWLR